MKVDYHVHTSLCGHARGRMRQYVEEAIVRGIAKMGFSDHTPLPPDKADPSLAMTEAQMADYVETVLALRAEYKGQIQIALGFEADYIPGFEEKLTELLRPFPLDYVSGSVHFLGRWAFDNPSEREQYDSWEPDRLYKRYFATLCQAAKSGLFDFMAHPDLIKKFNYWPSGPLEPFWAQAAAAFKESKVAIELNSAGWHKEVAEAYPNPGFLRACALAGVPVTFGSDAHAPEQVGRDWQRAVKTLREAGYGEIATFQGRCVTLEPLSV